MKEEEEKNNIANNSNISISDINPSFIGSKHPFVSDISIKK
jgi:hypothetical protein